MLSDETEWSMQKRLTASWLGQEQVRLNGEPLFLAAWEVMTNYKVNDARRHWNVPSIDFLFLDSAGRMVLVELKRAVRTPREGWNVVCQVSHRAQALAAGFSQPLIESAYIDCRSGLDGRTMPSTDPAQLLQGHADAFRQPPLNRLPALPVRRMVMAEEFRAFFAKVLLAMNASTQDELATILGRYKRIGEIKRYLDLPPDPALVDMRPIGAVTTDGIAWPEAAAG